ncbi:hypothetical protein ACERIM_07405 [Natrinema sp. H-ect1]|uniref:hypothetical protein n=1 Tax=Natrinema sp. H-ect1 TaxID=3242700 RepID=UPI00359E36AC
MPAFVAIVVLAVVLPDYCVSEHVSLDIHVGTDRETRPGLKVQSVLICDVELVLLVVFADEKFGRCLVLEHR